MGLRFCVNYKNQSSGKRLIILHLIALRICIKYKTMFYSTTVVSTQRNNQNIYTIRTKHCVRKEARIKKNKIRVNKIMNYLSSRCA